MSHNTLCLNSLKAGVRTLGSEARTMETLADTVRQRELDLAVLYTRCVKNNSLLIIKVSLNMT